MAQRPKKTTIRLRLMDGLLIILILCSNFNFSYMVICVHNYSQVTLCDDSIWKCNTLCKTIPLLINYSACITRYEPL